MKKHKLLLATTILALTLGATTQSQVTAETASPAGVVVGKSLEVKKVVDYTDPDVLMPETTFTFKIEASNTGVGQKVNNLEVKQGIVEGLDTQKTIDYKNTDKVEHKEKTTNFDFSNVKFTDIGVYRYTVSEESGNVVGIQYDARKWIVDVYVVNNGQGGFEVKYIESKEEGTQEKKPVVFNNSFRTTSLKIQKKVTGNTGELQKDFIFKLTLNGNDNFKAGQKVKAVKGTKLEEIALSQELKFSLKNGESLELSKLPVGITYTVTEEEANQNGYKTTATLKDGEQEPTSYELGKQQQTDTNKDEILVTNHREAQVPTGVVGTLAPFAALSIVAIGGVLYITKRKKA